MILDVTPKKEITWGCIYSVLYMTPTIILNNPVSLTSIQCLAKNSKNARRKRYVEGKQNVIPEIARERDLRVSVCLSTCPPIRLQVRPSLMY